MPRRADVPCAGSCGALLWRSKTSLPPGEAMCRSCRAERRASGDDSWRKKHFCTCGAKVWGGSTRCRPCADAERSRAARGVDLQLQRARWRNKSHVRRARMKGTDITATWEDRIRARAKNCPLCRNELTNVPMLPNSKELDHKQPLGAGGRHVKKNVWVICRHCNVRRPRDGSDLLTNTNVRAYAGTAT